MKCFFHIFHFKLQCWLACKEFCKVCGEILSEFAFNLFFFSKYYLIFFYLKQISRKTKSDENLNAISDMISEFFCALCSPTPQQVDRYIQINKKGSVMI